MPERIKPAAPKEVYIGDGVYAQYDGNIKLYTQEGQEIFLEFEVLRALNYWVKSWAPPHIKIV